MEFWKKYCPVVPVENHDDILYRRQDPLVFLMVKAEKGKHKQLVQEVKRISWMGTKLLKERVESIAFGLKESSTRIRIQHQKTW
jgi:hypothetical protein